MHQRHNGNDDQADDETDERGDQRVDRPRENITDGVEVGHRALEIVNKIVRGMPTEFGSTDEQMCPPTQSIAAMPITESAPNSLGIAETISARRVATCRGPLAEDNPSRPS